MGVVVRNQEDGDVVVARRQGAGEIRRDASFVIAQWIGLVDIVGGNRIDPPYQDQVAERGRVGFSGYLEGNALRGGLAAGGFHDQGFQSVFAWKQDEVTMQRDHLGAFNVGLVEGDALRG